MLRGEGVKVYAPTVTYDANTRDEAATWTVTAVDNVLWGQPTTEQVDEAMRLHGIHAQYTLGVPKSFAGSMRGCYVTRDRDGTDPPKYWVVGDPMPLPPEICPTDWNREAVVGRSDG